MPYLTQLAKVARRTGYPVTEVKGWESRGHGPQPSVQGIVCHHTAGASAGGDYPSLAVVRDGRAGLSGPLSHFGLGRSGRIYVIAAGRCWHNAPSTSSHHTNCASIGIEAENDGRQPWPAAQLDAYKKLCAELCREFGLPASRVKGHKEVNTQKPDPHSVNMNAFRADVARLIAGGSLPQQEEDDMPEYVSVGIDKPIDLPPGQWVTVAWGKEYSDRDHHHWNEGGTTFVVGPARYSCTANVRIDGLAPGTELQARVIEVAEDGSKTEPGPIAEYTASQGATFLHYNLAADTVNSKFRVRFQVIHYGTETGRITSGSAKAFAWPT